MVLKTRLDSEEKPKLCKLRVFQDFLKWFASSVKSNFLLKYCSGCTITAK